MFSRTETVELLAASIVSYPSETGVREIWRDCLEGL
jgi:hypothetical protein